MTKSQIRMLNLKTTNRAALGVGKVFWVMFRVGCRRRRSTTHPCLLRVIFLVGGIRSRGICIRLPEVRVDKYVRVVRHTTCEHDRSWSLEIPLTPPTVYPMNLGPVLELSIPAAEWITGRSKIDRNATEAPFGPGNSAPCPWRAGVLWT